MEETESHGRQLETFLQHQICQIEELDRKLQEQMSFLQEKKREWKNVGKAQRDQIKLMKQIISSADKDWIKLIDTLPCDIKEQKDAHLQTDRMDQVDTSSIVKLRNGTECWKNSSAFS